MLFLSLARSLSLSLRVPCSHRSNPLVPPKMFHLCPHLDSTYHPRMSSDAPNLSEGPCCSSRALPPTWLLVLLHPQQIHPLIPPVHPMQYHPSLSLCNNDCPVQLCFVQKRERKKRVHKNMILCKMRYILKKNIFMV